MKPRVYLAGKIAKNDWRHDLVPRLNRWDWSCGPISAFAFDYVGPFFISCNHGGSHAANSHGMSAVCGANHSQQEIINLCNDAVRKTDLFFAYITATTCHGTLTELGMALALQKRVVIAFAPCIGEEELWFPALQADARYYEVGLENLSAIFRAEVAKTSSMINGELVTAAG